MNQGGGPLRPVWPGSGHMALHSVSDPGDHSIDIKIKLEPKVTEVDGRSIVDGAETARAGLEVLMRQKKPKIVCGSGGMSGSQDLDNERPMSWEWEQSEEDSLAKGMEEMSPSPLPGRITAMDPGSPMSTNDSDKEDFVPGNTRKVTKL